jgi:putative endopeptidase
VEASNVAGDLTMQPIRWILAAAVLCGCSACSPSSESGQAPAASGTAAAASAATVAAAPTIGIDLAGIDHAAKPGDDFFAYANGTWLQTAEIPADRSSTGTFLKVFEKAQQRTADLIRDAGKDNPAAGSNTRKIADYYAAFMDEATIEKHGLQPLQPELSAVDGIASRTDLARVLGSRLRADVDPLNATDYHTQNLFGLFVTQGLEDPSQNIGYLLQGGLGMPSRDYYLSNDKAMQGFRDAYKTYIAALLEQAGTADADAKANAVFELETKIARAQETLLDTQDVHKANNLWSMADFAKKAPGLDWSTYFKAAGLDGQKQLDVCKTRDISSKTEH